MKNVKIDHQFTLKEILLSIKKCVKYNSCFQEDRDRMIDKINYYLKIIVP
jgi:hypothetical protein